MSQSYPHMCRDGHIEIGHADSEHERCPLCRVIDHGTMLVIALDRIITLSDERIGDIPEGPLYDCLAQIMAMALTAKREMPG